MNGQPSRKPNRLSCYDYRSPGYYFITICTYGKQKKLWDIGSGKMALSKAGEVVDLCIRDITKHYPYALVDKYTIMPNHVHIILQILPSHERRSVGEIIGHMKQAVSTILGERIWQKGFHDHIIRNESEYQKIWLYIDYNPTKWLDDCYYC